VILFFSCGAHAEELQQAPQAPEPSGNVVNDTLETLHNRISAMEASVDGLIAKANDQTASEADRADAKAQLIAMNTEYKKIKAQIYTMYIAQTIVQTVQSQTPHPN